MTKFAEIASKLTGHDFESIASNAQMDLIKAVHLAMNLPASASRKALIGLSQADCLKIAFDELSREFPETNLSELAREAMRIEDIVGLLIHSLKSVKKYIRKAVDLSPDGLERALMDGIVFEIGEILEQNLDYKLSYYSLPGDFQDLMTVPDKDYGKAIAILEAALLEREMVGRGSEREEKGRRRI